VVIRYPRGEARQMAESEVGTGLSARRLAEGDGGICLLAVGRMLETAEEAAALLAERGHAATVWDVRSCSVLDPAMLADADRHGVVVTIEDGIAAGGVGAAIIGALGDSPRTAALGLPTAFIPQGSPAEILHRLGLDGEGVAAACLRLLD
jgi:1-deoxy-D-xylulose-5-phosphate synthase